MTKSDFVRRRIAPIAFGVVIVLMARESCVKEERTHATFVLDFGAAVRDVHAVDAELWIEGDQLAVFHRVALDHMSIGTAKFTAALPAHDGEVRIDVELANGEHRKLTRPVHADEGATVTIPLEAALK